MSLLIRHISVRTFRVRMFQALAQAAASPVTPAPTVAGSPSQVSVVALFPSVPGAWGSNNLAQIQTIVNALNNAIFVLSQGQSDFNRFRVVGFQDASTQVPDMYLLAVIRFAKAFYSTVLNNAQPFTAALTPQDKGTRITRLLTTLASSNIPDGSINQQLPPKIGGNLKVILTDTLRLIR